MNRPSIDKAINAQLDRIDSLLMSVAEHQGAPWIFHQRLGHHHATRDLLLREGLIDDYCAAVTMTKGGWMALAEIKAATSVCKPEETP